MSTILGNDYYGDLTINMILSFQKEGKNLVLLAGATSGLLMALLFRALMSKVGLSNIVIIPVFFPPSGKGRVNEDHIFIPTRYTDLASSDDIVMKFDDRGSPGGWSYQYLGRALEIYKERMR